MTEETKQYIKTELDTARRLAKDIPPLWKVSLPFVLGALILGLLISLSFSMMLSISIFPLLLSGIGFGVSTLYYDINYSKYSIPETLWFVEFTYDKKDVGLVNDKALTYWTSSELRYRTDEGSSVQTPVAVMIGDFLENGKFSTGFLPASYITHQEEIQTKDY